MKQVVSAEEVAVFRQTITQFLYSKIEYLLIGLFVLCLAGAVALLPYLSGTLSNSLAIEEARRYARALSEIRSAYTSEVVARVMSHNIEVTHDYLEREGTIPLPATFSMLLGERLGAIGKGEQIRLYSEYPFPWRKDGGFQDDFEREAFRQLQQNPTQPYYRFETRNGIAVLRYATADIMTNNACVSCHNSHPQTPKTGWKVGDLRGVLEIIQPLENASNIVNGVLAKLVPFIIVLGCSGTIGLHFAFRKLRLNSEELETQIAKRTKSLNEIIQEWQDESEQRKESEEKFKGLFEAAYDPLVVVDDTGRILLLNNQVERMLGYSQQELLGQPVECLVPDRFRDSHPDHRATYGALSNHDQTRRRNKELWIKRRDGGEFPVEISLSPFQEKGETRVLCTVRDISERKTAEESLQAAHADTERLLSAISSILIGVDEQGKIRRWNRIAENTFGLSTTQTVGRTMREANIPWDISAVEQGIRKCQTHEDTTLLEVPYSSPSRGDGILSLTFTRVLSEGKQTSGYLILGLDVTEHRNLVGQLALAQKMESIGQLAAGIAHEINTPTQFVGDNLRFLQDSFTTLHSVLTAYDTLLHAVESGASPAPHLLNNVKTSLAEADLDYMTEEIPKALQQSLEGAERVARIVRAMKDFSHPGTGEKKPTDLNKAIESTATVARNEWKYVADLTLDLDPSLPPVSCLPGEFNQVLLNLIINAAHGIGSKLGANPENQKGQITISSKDAGEWVEVRVRDTGTGIPQAIRSKIFDPFFTTKEVGKGTGQGLAIAHDVIVTKHGGALTFETEMGIGTTFVIRLPLTLRTSSREAL